MADPEDPLEAFYAAHPELRPGAPAGATIGSMFKPGAATVPAPTGAKPAAAPPQPPAIPPGFKAGPTPGQVLRLDGFAGMTLDPKTNQYVPDLYAPSAVTLAAAGIVKGGGGGGTPKVATSTGGGTPRTGTGGSTTNYAAQNLQDRIATLSTAPGIAAKDALVARGARALGDNLLILPNGDKFSLRNDGTGLYGAFGRASAAETKALGQQMMNEGLQNRTGAATASLTPEARPFAGLGGAIDTLGPRNGPVVPGMEAFRQPSIGIPTEGRHTINGVSNALNSMQAGRQGSATQFPVSPGFRLAGQEAANSIPFGSGNQSNGRLEPAALFGPTSVSVPDTYVFGQGNVNDANRAYGVPFNIGPGGAALANIGGNNVQINSADKGTGFGFALNPMTASSVGALTGRDLAEDPASQAAQTLMLQAALATPGGLAAVTAANPNQFGGWHAGTGNGPNSGNGGQGQGTWFGGYDPNEESNGLQYYAGGGRIAVRPLGVPATTSPHSMVTNEPIMGIGMMSGRPRFVVGEDNADPGSAPNRERLDFRNNSMNVTPLQPFAGGGQVQFQPQQQQQMMQPPMNYWDWVEAALTRQAYGGNVGVRTFAEGGTVNIDPGGIPVDSRTGVVPRVSSISDTATNPTDLLNPPPAPPVVDPALDPAILAPWEKAQQGLAQQEHLRNVVDEPRRRAAGFVANSVTGIPVLQGEIPTTPLGPGSFYDLRPQVDRNVNDILSAQSDIRRFGPEQDSTPWYEEVSTIGLQREAKNKLDSLALQKAGLEATNEIQKQQALLEYTQSGDALAAAQSALNNAIAAAQLTNLPEDQQRVLDFQAKLAAIEAGRQDALTRSQGDSPALIALRAQEAALQAQLPQGWSEAQAMTRLATLNKQISDQEKRATKVVEVGNLAKIGVPKLNAPILRVA